jgi:hypothetical protein
MDSNVIVITPKRGYVDAFQIEFLDRGFLIGKRYYKYSNIIEVGMDVSWGGVHSLPHPLNKLYICYGIEARTLLYSTTHNQNDGSDKERDDAARQYATMNKIYDTLLEKRDAYARQKR